MTTALHAFAETEDWSARHAAPVPPKPLRRWVMDCVALCLPEHVYWCDGSEAEQQTLLAETKAENELTELPAAAPNSPTGAAAQVAGKHCLRARFRDCMRGRAMYVVPFVLKAVNGAPAVVGMQLTDSAEAALNTQAGSLRGDAAWSELAKSASGLRCLHSVGRARATKAQYHYFPLEQTICAFGGRHDLKVLTRGLNVMWNVTRKEGLKWVESPQPLSALPGTPPVFKDILVAMDDEEPARGPCRPHSC